MSLRARILCLVLAAACLPLLCMLWLLVENRNATEQQMRAQMLGQTEQLARELDDKISGTAQLLFGLARVPVLAEGSKTACSEFLADVLNEHPQYTGLLTISPDGALRCDSLHSGRDLNLTDRAYFKQALRSHDPAIELVMGRLSGKAVLQVAYAVRDAKANVRFVLLASLDMDAFGQLAGRNLGYSDSHILFWSRDGKTIVDSPSPGKQKLSPKELASGITDATQPAEAVNRSTRLGRSSQANIWAKTELRRFPDAALSLAIVVPSSELRQGVDLYYKRALIGLAVLAITIVLLAAFLVEFAVQRQVTRMMRAIARINAGDYNTRIGHPYASGELGQVMRALDRMTSSLLRQDQEIIGKTRDLERQARIDSLTSLANRHMLNERLAYALDFARRAQRIAGVLMLDLDRFKTVNDSLGHHQGDILLREVATRLQACVREGDTVARLGGDEFVVVLADMAEVSDIEILANKILQALAEPVSMGPQTLSVSTSLGIAIFPRDGETADSLLQYADTAMYRAKERGGNAMAFFSPQMMLSIVNRLRLEAGLRRAQQHNELRLHFQAIIDARTGRICGAEALLRWQDPEVGLVSPADFIPVAEETGLIVPIGEWVLLEACRQAAAWHALGLGHIPVAVNLSPQQFNAPSLDSSVAQALRTTHCPPHLLHLEITESSVMAQVEQALETMHQLTALGVELSIDDFGTGYSSLSQLKLFPVRTLKIDRSFVRDIQIDANDDILVDAIITLAKKLGLSTIAEGVETPEQVAFLAAKGCDKYQGFLFSRPCAVDEFVAFIQAHQAQHGSAPADL